MHDKAIFFFIFFYFLLCRNFSDVLLYAILYFPRVRSPLKRSDIKLHHLMSLLWLLLRSTSVSSFTGTKLKLAFYVIIFCITIRRLLTNHIKLSWVHYILMTFHLCCPSGIGCNGDIGAEVSWLNEGLNLLH